MEDFNLEKVCVIGLGYIGLPTAAILARSGLQVLGVDVDTGKVNRLQSGEFEGQVEPGLTDLLHEVARERRIRFSTVPEPADAFIVAVPTPINPNHTADLRYVAAATETIDPYLCPGNLVVLESTVPPGTVEDVMLPILRRTGLVPGQDVFVAHCPERVIPGKLLQELVSNSRVVGGIDRRSSELAASLYRRFVEGEILLTDATTAEMVKLMENTFRDVNIALANEFARICQRLGLNVWEAISLANRHPRVQFLRPGPGVVGHCIAVDPWFIVEKAPDEARIIALARQTNDGMPEFTASLIEKTIGRVAGASVAVLGLAFKGDVEDTRESPAMHVIELLRDRGLAVRAYDPHAPGRLPEQVETVATCVRGVDAVVILTDHTAFKSLEPAELAGLVRRRLVIDARACLDRPRWEAAGFEYLALGDGTGMPQVEGKASARSSAPHVAG